MGSDSSSTHGPSSTASVPLLAVVVNWTAVIQK
jgi:hypothetical protein